LQGIKSTDVLEKRFKRFLKVFSCLQVVIVAPIFYFWELFQNQNVRIFVVEDDPWYSRLLEKHLSLNPDHEVEVFSNGRDLRAALQRSPQVITLDYRLPDVSCEHLVQDIKRVDPDINIIVISGQDDINTAVSLLKSGVYDYMTKNEETRDLLWNSLRHLQEKQQLKEEIKTLRQEITQRYDFEKLIIGNSKPVRRIFDLMEKAASTNIMVSISGETGTGKELVAKSIHYNSPMSAKPFVVVNMAAIPSELIESELFGYEKGAFTGAVGSRKGKFEEANGGTIFLDEIAELDLSLQAKLLRVLQEREVTRIGSNQTIKLQVRVIVATHRNLAEQVQQKKFREDLYYRLLGLPIHLPPLRDRGHDVILLAYHFLHQFCKENSLPRKSISGEAREKLLNYPWPGNVRELKAVVELSAVMASDDEIDAHDISLGHGNAIPQFLMENLTLDEYNYRIIEHFLRKNDNNVVRAAEKLGVGKSTIYRLIKEGKINHG
jgi:DNA-binding NtrC family response regulator